MDGWTAGRNDHDIPGNYDEEQQIHGSVATEEEERKRVVVLLTRALIPRQGNY